jgi:hypothetical protein
METLVKGKHDIPIMVVEFRLESINAIRASNYFSLACREWKASFLSLTLKISGGQSVGGFISRFCVPTAGS